jgi:hypothetical protein
MSAALLQNLLVGVVVFDALAWLLGTLPTLAYALQRGELPVLMGIRLLSGPFERLGLPALIVAGLLYAAISALKLLAAYWLAQGRRDGVVLELVLLGLSAIFWYGFALPFGPLAGVPEFILLLLAWGRLR